jgi:hypothetical protein
MVIQSLLDDNRIFRRVLNVSVENKPGEHRRMWIKHLDKMTDEWIPKQIKKTKTKGRRD